MNIIDKLNLQRQLGGLVLFREGIFLRGYNESSYILTQLLKQNRLKLSCDYIKRIQSHVITCAFPMSSLSERVPKAVVTEFGVQLAMDFDLSGYRHWFLNRCASNDSKPHNTAAPASVVWAAESVENLDDSPFTLTAQQRHYLTYWQKGAYPIEVDLAFIEGLQTKLLE